MSAIRKDSPAGRCNGLYVGDALLTANGQSLEGVSHEELINILQQLHGEVSLEVVFCAGDQARTAAGFRDWVRKKNEMPSVRCACCEGQIRPLAEQRSSVSSVAPPSPSAIADVLDSRLVQSSLLDAEWQAAVCAERLAVEEQARQQQATTYLPSRRSTPCQASAEDKKYAQHASAAENSELMEQDLAVGKLEPRAVQVFCQNSTDYPYNEDLFSV